MNHKVMVPTLISQAIGAFEISREMRNRLLTAIHADVPRNYEQCRLSRSVKDNRYYRDRVILDNARLRHLFILTVDDSTAQGVLIIVDVFHTTRPFPSKS